MKKHIDLIIGALEQHQGDNAPRARFAFKGCTPEQMKEEYGQSGETKQEILDGYEQHEKACQDAKAWIQEQFR